MTECKKHDLLPRGLLCYCRACTLESLPAIDYDLALRQLEAVEPIPGMVNVTLKCTFCRRAVAGQIRVRRGAKVDYTCAGCRAEGRSL